MLIFVPDLGTVTVCLKQVRGEIMTSNQYSKLIVLLKLSRENNGSSMETLAACLDEPHSFIQKVESLERRLDAYEYVHYARHQTLIHVQAQKGFWKIRVAGWGVNLDKKLEQSLGKCFPFFRRSKDNETLFNTFGFECGPGWVPLLIQFAESTESLDIYNVKIFQIKEKWDSLRIYYEAGGLDQDILENIVNKLEYKSATTCEICGNTYDRDLGCCRDGDVDLNDINERMLLLIENKPIY